MVDISINCCDNTHMVQDCFYCILLFCRQRIAMIVDFVVLKCKHVARQAFASVDWRYF
ncbi:hypothetical protein GCK32_022640 [Trichostrongylus colubriformis]|uniref:Uncharacterized protein n=1 Tax=Trichostrongylus colubriformis TaxID=6319 RepID=A0AAN8F235_TRICO